jgi:hypothetical protein
MVENLTRVEYEILLRQDFTTFAARCFYDLNPQTELATNWHVEVIADRLTAVRQRKIRRLIINLPPRHLKSLLASIAFPAWCLGHDPSAQILCVSYAEALSNKLARDCRSIIMSPWYRRIFPTRLAAHRQAVQEFLTTREGYRLATSNGGVLTGRGADIILIDDPLKPEEALSDTQRQAANDWFSHTLYSRLNDKRTGAIVIIMQRFTRTISSAMCSLRSRGMSPPFRQSRKRMRCTTSRRSWAHVPSSAGVAKRCIPSANRSTRSTASVARSGNTILPANTSNLPHPWRRPGESAMVQVLRRERSAGGLRPHCVELGYRKQSDRAQRFQRLHDLGR